MRAVVAGLCLCIVIAAAAEPEPGIVSHIPRQPVQSRAIRAVGYSKSLRALEIEFIRGGTYRYLEVPATVYRELLVARSKTRFYNANIRGRYHSVFVRPRKSAARSANTRDE